MPKSGQESILSNDLYLFLRQFPSDGRGQKFTHTSIGKPTGSYNIPLSKLEEFYNLYTKTVFVDKVPVHLTEGIRDCTYTPVKIDIDFRYYGKTLERKYTTDDILEICKKYMTHLEEYLSEPEKEEREFFISEKPSPIFDLDKKGEKKTNSEGLFRIKDGVHIMAPRLITNVYVQQEVRNKVYKNVGDILDKHKFDNSYSDIFDRLVIDTNNWQMYGSCKPGKSTYLLKKLVRVYPNKTENVSINKYKNHELVTLLSVRNRDGEESLIRPEKENEVYQTVVNTSRLLSEKEKEKYNKIK